MHPQWGDGPYVYLYNYNNGSSQQITYTSAGKLQSVANTADYLYNDGGSLALGSSGDTFSITSSGTGYTIQDTSAGGLYVNNTGAIDPPNKLTLSTTPTVWMFPVVSGGGGGGTPLATGNPYTFQDGSGYTMDLGWAQNPQWGDGQFRLPLQIQRRVAANKSSTPLPANSNPRQALPKISMTVAVSLP